MSKHYIKGLVFSFVVFIGFTQRESRNGLPVQTAENGGLFLPEGFEATVVVDSLPGRARHLAVNDNGDIYVKARFARDKDESVIALRDTNGDGRADVIKRFGGLARERAYGTAMRIYNGYLYFSSELYVYRYKLKPGQLVPDSPMEVVLTDDHKHGMHEHIAKPITFDKEGHIYVAYGAPSNACQEKNRNAWCSRNQSVSAAGRSRRYLAVRRQQDQPNAKRRSAVRYRSAERSRDGLEFRQ